MKRLRVLLGLAIVILSFNAVAQKSNERLIWVKELNKPLMLDTLSVVPGSVKVVDSLSNTKVHHDIQNGLIRFESESEYDSIQVMYKVFPYSFNKTVFNKNLSEYDSNAYFKTVGIVNKKYLVDRREELFSTENLYKSGMVSRGITFGNRQNIFVNSVLNLQLDGKLSENLNIRASITDQNIPYQPEGNTKLIQDFDNVFFEIYNDHFSLAGGDIILKNSNSHFLKYYRNVQGASIGARYQPGKDVSAESKLAVSVSKGKFSTYKLEVLDGVMGPYKIYGPNNETYLIILANSEKVFLDGRLLTRGYNHDYVIDYNTAEITFTSRLLITKYSRIQIDFEYSNQAYSRTVVAASHDQSFKKADISIQYYQEKDNPNQPLTFQLTDIEKELLSQAIPDQGMVMIPGWDSVGYSDSRVLYKKIDALNDEGKVTTIFKYTNDPDSANYQVIFTEVPYGKGDYVRKSSNLNGKLYEWTTPVQGLSQGNYIPMRVIPIPNKKQMISVGSQVKVGNNEKIFMELAFSNHDDNLYNNKNSGIKGFALKTGLVSKDKNIQFLPGYKFTGQVDFEYDDKSFNPIDRFREVEYNRNWSFNPLEVDAPASDKIVNAKMSVNNGNGNFVDLGISRRKMKSYIDGWQGYSNVRFSNRLLNITGDFFWMDNEGKDHSNWMRYKVGASFNSKIVVPGYEFTVDRNIITPFNSDSIIYSANNYEEHRFYIRSNDSLKTRFNLNYSLRKDRLPLFGEMINNNISRTANASVGTQKGKLGVLDLNVTYRELVYIATEGRPVQKSLLGRLDWFSTFLNKHIRSELSYSIGNGRELKREYIFIQVPVGEGTHTWRDDNGDGIQDIDEFYIAINIDEKNYIKLFTPTDEYVLAYDNNLNYRIHTEMPRSWKGSNGVKNLLSRFSNSLSINLKQKIANDDIFKNLIFSKSDVFAKDLLSYRENIRNTLFFNRADPRYGSEFLFYHFNNKQLLSNGYEARNNSKLQWMTRLRINRDYNVRMTLGKSMIESSSDFLTGRNYIIDSRSVGANIEWQPSSNFRISTNYSYSENINIAGIEPGDEKSAINEALVNVKFAKASDKNIDLTIRYTLIQFDGKENSPVGYELLKALKPGENLTWSLGWQQKLFSGLQVNIFYEGRKSGDLDVIHIGRMQVMAMF